MKKLLLLLLLTACCEPLAPTPCSPEYRKVLVDNVYTCVPR